MSLKEQGQVIKLATPEQELEAFVNLFRTHQLNDFFNGRKHGKT